MSEGKSLNPSSPTPTALGTCSSVGRPLRKRSQPARFESHAYQWQILADRNANKSTNTPTHESMAVPVARPHPLTAAAVSAVLSYGPSEFQQPSGATAAESSSTTKAATSPAVAATSPGSEGEEFQILVGIPGLSGKVALPQMSIDREPRYVNSRQYRRIIKRREWRELNARDLIKASKEKERVARQGYKYKSRHLHAKRRRRGPGGKFLTKKELAELEAKEAAEKSLRIANGDAHPSSERVETGGGIDKSGAAGPEKDGVEKKEDLTFSHPFLHGWTAEQVEDFLKLFDSHGPPA